VCISIAAIGRRYSCGLLTIQLTVGFEGHRSRRDSRGTVGGLRLRLGYPYLTQRAARSIRSRCELECGYFAEPAVHADPIHDKE